MEQQVTATVSALKRMLDNANFQGTLVKRVWSTWFSPNQRAKPANDASFVRPQPPLAPNSKHSGAKKSANAAGIRLILRTWCQKVRTSRNGTEARRYWGFWDICPEGPGVKTLTPPQKIQAA